MWIGTRENKSFQHLKVLVVKVIKASINDYTHQTIDDSSEDQDSDLDNGVETRTVNDFIMKTAEFNILVEKLPKIFDVFKVQYELDDGKILINVLPAPIHARAVNTWSGLIAAWASNNTVDDTNEPALENTGRTRIILCYSSAYFLATLGLLVGRNLRMFHSLREI
jgi:hypothetical protein